MRNTFAAALTDLASHDERVFLLSGDIGNRLFNEYKDRFPGRFLNCGVAEANMTGIAAGLALSGLRPFTYTIAPFNTTRCLEQIKVDVCYQDLPVVIVGVGAGLSYSELGPTHTACEDIAILRTLPNMTIVCPADPREVASALCAALQHPGPLYLRLGKKGEPVIHETEPEFRIGAGIVLQEGTDVCLLGTGTILPETVVAARRLDRLGISTRLVSCHTVKPLDEDLLEDVFSRFKVVATVEEHSVIGGLGGAVAEWLADHFPLRAQLCRIGVADRFAGDVGNQPLARQHYGLASDQIVERVCQAHSGLASSAGG
jgi:transketolase